MTFTKRARYIIISCIAPELLGLLAIFVLSASLLGGCGGPSKEQIQAWRETADEIQSLDNLATRLYRQGRYAEAEPYVRRIIETIEKEVGPDNLKLAQPRNNLAVICEKTGDDRQAEFNYLRVLTILEMSLGPENPKVGEAMIGVAGFYQRSGRLEESRKNVRTGSGPPDRGPGR